MERKIRAIERMVCRGRRRNVVVSEQDVPFHAMDHVVSDEVHRGVALSDPGIDDSRNELLWSPNAPNLIDVELELWMGWPVLFPDE